MNKQQPIQKSKAGCYAVIGKKQPEIELPLKYFHYQIEIVECFTQVKMTQLYFNNQNKVLEVSYIFPIHPSCIVTNLQIKFGGNTTRGVVMQRSQADKQFKKYMEQGAEAAYAAYYPQSRDVMKMKVGNIPPNQEIKITLCYNHINSLVCNMFYEFKLASTMTPRYASNLDQNQLKYISQLQNKGFSSKCFWGLTIAIKPQASRKLTKIQSKSHKIQMDQYNNITFANPQLPNRDFSLYYAFQNYEKPSFLLSHTDNNTIAAISFIPKFTQLSLDDALSQAMKGKNNQVNLDASKGQYIFLLDRSGSMEGIRIDNAKRSLQIFLRSLPQNSYFNVLSFGSSYQYLFKESKKNEKQWIDKAVDEINQMSADMGGTQILQAIQKLVCQPVIEGYPRQLFFLTDGAVSYVSQVLKFISKHTQYTRVNSIGIGNGCSQELIQGCAQRGKGYFTFIRDDEMPEQKIIALLENTLSPVISEVYLSYDKSKIQSIVPNPDNIPYLLKNDIANFYITFKSKLYTPFNFQLKYSNSLGKKYSQKITIDPQVGSNCKWIQNIANFQKIKALSDSYEYNQQIQNRLYYVKKLNKKQLKQQIINQSIKYQILTDFTAFLCVDILIADEVKKLNLQKDKQYFNMYGMNPYDYMVNFCQENINSSSGLYVDQCCVINYEDPPEELQKISKFQEIAKVYRPMQLIGKLAGQKKYFQINGISKFTSPQKRLAYIFIVKRQETNGSWTEDFIDSLFVDADKMKDTFRHVDRISLRTFLVCQYLIRFYSSEAQFSMIIKKGKNYINKNSKILWSELEELFHRYHYEPIAQQADK